MTNDTSDLAALVGSRMCHDLISPLGAIGNGVELLSMTKGGAGRAELALIEESVQAANAKLRFFRMSFGRAGGQDISPREITTLMDDATRIGRARIHWSPTGNVQRDMVQIVCLALLCLETAMPRGGDVVIDTHMGQWQLTGTTTALKIDPDLWGNLTGVPSKPTSATVQFALLTACVAKVNRHIRWQAEDNTIQMSF